MTSSVVVPVSGAHNNVLVSGDSNSDLDCYRAMATINEMDRVESAFEDFRTKINGMNLQFPQHSLFPRVHELVETMVWPVDEITK